jgi:alpha-1,3-rhamnosyl/mannosyltransferase
MNVAIDASCLVVNPYSGLSEVVHNLLLNIPVVAEDAHFTMFMNYFRGTRYQEIYPGIDSRSLRLPRRLVDRWWKHRWPPFDLYLREIDIFHSLHIQVPPAKRMKTVLTIHDCRYLAFPELYKSKEVENYRRQMEISLNRVGLVATVSEFTRQEVLNYFSFPEDRVRVIHNGFKAYLSNRAYNKENINRFTKENALPKDYLLYAGVLDPRKNLGRLIEAMARCREEAHDFPVLVIAGISYEQWTRSDQAGIAKKLGVFDNIYLCGIVEKNILAGLTKRALALCYPSLYEGFGFPPLEAMSLGVPVLAGNGSSIPEVTANAACLIDPSNVDDIAQGLKKIVFDSNYRKTLIESGYQRIKKFSWKKAAAEYINLYKEVIAL